jgi:magnesium-transporting ATPase (P-type)
MKIRYTYWVLSVIPLTYFLIYDLRAGLDEDGVVESIGAFSFLISGLIFVYLFIYKNNDKHYKFLGKLTKRNIYFILLGILFLMAFGEEISWGQRIFNWDTPDEFKHLNAQQETNLHNLWWFQAYREDGTYKSFFENMLNFNRLFNMFWLLYCVVIPLTSIISKKGRKIINHLGIPLVPLWIGMFFILNYTVFIIIIKFYPIDNFSFDELKESFYAIGFTFLSLHFLKLNSLSEIKDQNTIV